MKQLNTEEFASFDLLAGNDELINESATCERHDFFEFIVTSSQIIGYASLQTYFVKTKSKKIPYIRCSVFNKECNCIPLNNKVNSVNRENFLKS